MNSSSATPSPATTPAPRIWTSLDLITWTKTFFEKKGIESPRLEAELLLSEVLGCPRIKLYADFEKAVGAEQLARYREMVKRRGEAREPLQYILGHSQFIDLKIKVTPAALIPRPETEVLAEWAVEKAKAAGENPDVLDLCTGTGCVALYVASKMAGAKVTASDLSQDALALAAENAKALGLESRVAFKAGDLFASLGESMRFDLITANPPYIDPAQRATLQVEVRDFEPGMALFAENEGLAVTERIIAECPAWLKPGGWIGIDFGAGQEDILKSLAERTAGLEEVEIRKDHLQKKRFLLARRTGA